MLLAATSCNTVKPANKRTQNTLPTACEPKLRRKSKNKSKSWCLGSTRTLHLKFCRLNQTSLPKFRPSSCSILLLRTRMTKNISHHTSSQARSKSQKRATHSSLPHPQLRSRPLSKRLPSGSRPLQTWFVWPWLSKPTCPISTCRSSGWRASSVSSNTQSPSPACGDLTNLINLRAPNPTNLIEMRRLGSKTK